MSREKQIASDPPESLRRHFGSTAARAHCARFVDSYVVENSRHALQVHASLYRDLLTLLQREALLL